MPDCLVTSYEKLVNSIELPDPDDRHVVAATIVGHADAIVTFNTKDFPQAILQPYSIEVQRFNWNLSLLQNPKFELIYFAKRCKKRETGGHLWHDGVNQNDTVTPAP